MWRRSVPLSLAAALATGTPLPAGAYYVNAYAYAAGDGLIGPADGPAANVAATLVLR